MSNDTDGLVPITTALANGGTATTRVPAYDRAKVTAGIAHIGVGNFHRVHQGLYLDDLLAARDDQFGWGLVGISLSGASPRATARANAYADQDCLYTVTAYTNDGTQNSRIVGAMVEYLNGPDDPAAVVARLADPAIKIVSLTVTEGGYNLDEETGEFRVDDPAIVADLARETPETSFGVITAALAARREAGVPPFTVMSCDNLRSNGDTARRAVVGYANAKDPELASWIEANVAFPNSMVDRIAPTVGAQARADLNQATGIADALPALTEEFTQWVLEDNFPQGRPAFEDVGVQLRPDVATFEAIKQRLLNASHMLLSYPAALSGYATVSEAGSDPAIAAVLNRFMEVDAIPFIEAPADVSLTDYMSMVVGRFANPHVPDTVLRVAHDGASKLPVFHRNTAEKLIASGADPRREALLLATFRRYTNGVDDHGNSFEVLEPHLQDADWPLLKSDNPLDALSASPFAAWGLADSPAFVAAYQEIVGLLENEGVPAALRYALADADG
ncbi:MAG: mannitol dehydrogenase family protein [Tetrasphaera sp.]